MQDYANYSLNELYDVYHHVNREKYPDMFEAVTDEIEKRKKDARLMNIAAATINPELYSESAWDKGDQKIPEQKMVLELKFHGEAREYFRIWIVNLCLTIITLGIFSAWAKVRKKRYFYSHTTLDGTPFQYLGRPIPILKGRVIATIVFSIYYISSHFFSSVLPYVLAAGALMAPWMIVRSVAFNARYCAYRNMVFHFDGKYMDALKTIYAWGLIPIIIIGTMFEWWGQQLFFFASVAVFSLAFPWWIRRLKRFIFIHTSYGGKNGGFSATGGQFFMVYLKASLAAGLFALVFGLFSTIIGSTLPLAYKSGFSIFLFMIPVYIGYVVAYAYVQAHSSNLVWNHARLGPLRFQSTLLARQMALLYITNALAIIASLGLLIPWAVMRTLKYRADHLQVIQEGNLSMFQGSESGNVQAAAAEIGDFFDVDLSL